ncbi:hypothetical protein GCM10010431_61330 [Streptomyces kunmingensis]
MGMYVPSIAGERRTSEILGTLRNSEYADNTLNAYNTVNTKLLPVLPLYASVQAPGEVPVRATP